MREYNPNRDHNLKYTGIHSGDGGYWSDRVFQLFCDKCGQILWSSNEKFFTNICYTSRIPKCEEFRISHPTAVNDFKLFQTQELLEL